MKLNSIVNNQAVQISSCDAEPIHIPGAIQPHGALIACDKTSLTIEYCSQNIQHWTGLLPEKILKQSITAISEPVAGLCRQFIAGEFPEHTEHTVTLQDIEVNLICHLSGHHLILEFTRVVIKRLTPSQTFELVTAFGKVIDRAANLVHLCQQVTEQIRSLTGFDRVMIYRFDKNYNGEVIAESRPNDMEPYLHLHYPHTDIPAQARELYTKQLVRLIPEVSFTPVPIVTFNQADNTALNLAGSHLRSVSPIHIQYLKNMQVSATLTVSLLLEGKLWGLIACHHRIPYQIDESRKQAALMLGQLLTSQIRVQENAEEYAVHLQVDAHLQKLLGNLNIHEDFDTQFQHFSSLPAVAGAGGVAILKDEELFTKGKVPAYDKIRALIKWLSQYISTTQYRTDSLIKKYPAAGDISAQAAGIFYYTLGEPGKDCIIWFRPEIEKTIHWAGNPHAEANKKAENLLMPRTSFALWKETVRHCSTSWKEAEINAAVQFASALRNQFHLQQVQAEKERQLVLNERLRKANNELSNINWIASHDLKEPIRKIQLFSAKVMREEGQELSHLVASAIDKIQQSATRMHTLVQDILSYSVIGEARNTTLQEVPLQEVVNEIIDDRRDEIAYIEVGELPVIKAKLSQVRQLFSNLIGNSIKYIKPGEKASISIQATIVTSLPAGVILPSNQAYHCIIVKDEGIGFANEESEKIFDIFVRLHNHTDYEGTGIGLAICKKIVEMNGGAIVAQGSQDGGAQFSIYLPL